MTNATLATHYETGRRWLLKTACRMSERKWLPALDGFCKAACEGDDRQAAALCRSIIAGIGAPQIAEGV